MVQHPSNFKQVHIQFNSEKSLGKSNEIFKILFQIISCQKIELKVFCLQYFALPFNLFVINIRIREEGEKNSSNPQRRNQENVAMEKKFITFYSQWKVFSARQLLTIMQEIHERTGVYDTCRGSNTSEKHLPCLSHCF